MKYKVEMVCGHECVVELFGKTSDRERKIEWYKHNRMCPECYKKYASEKTKEQGLVFNSRVYPQVDEKCGDFLVLVWFSGDTKPYKDSIKEIGGYRWGYCEYYPDYQPNPKMCWSKLIKLDDLEEEIEKAKSIGAAQILDEGENAKRFNYLEAARSRKRWESRNEEFSNLEKPIVPEIIKGRKWNRTVYGRPGMYAIYPENEKVSLTDEQAEEIMNYIKQKDEYDKKVKEIKRAHPL